MTPIEQQALALINEVRVSRESRLITLSEAERWFAATFPAIIRAVERHEAFKQEVSEAVAMFIHVGSSEEKEIALEVLKGFIIPKPDPLREAWTEAFGHAGAMLSPALLVEALAARNLEIVEKKS